MDDAGEFEMVRTALCKQVDWEILNLKQYLSELKEDEFQGDPDKTGEVCERIVYAAEGLKKLASVLSFFDCWEENGDIPQLNRTASFRQNES